MAGAANAIMGDDSFGTEIPMTEVDPDYLQTEQRMAKFSKSAEFKTLKEYIAGRIEFYQTYLPSGKNIEEVSAEERGNMWLVANMVSAEFKAIIGAYEQAAETIRDAAKKK